MPRTALIVLFMLALIVSPLHALTPRVKVVAGYSALRKGATITLTAIGENPTAGWTNTLAPVAGKPTEFTFTQTPPDGVAAAVITPFTTSVTLNSEAKMLIVVDSAWRHEVAVK